VAKSPPEEQPIMAATTIVWFRHDLRLDDNPALLAAARRGAVVPLFVWAPDEEAPWEPGAASRWWLHQSLERLAGALARAGTPLLVRRGPSLETLREVARAWSATHVVWNRRYEPAVIARDTAIKKALADDGLEVESHAGGLLFEPMKVATKEGRPYQVFTPFWRALLAREEPPEPVAAPRSLTAAKPATTSAGKAASKATGKGAGHAAASLPIADLGLLPAIDWAGTMRQTWTPGEAGGRDRLERFLADAVPAYHGERDRPDHDGTSSLSAHLHFGEISPRRVWHAVRAAVGGTPAARTTGGAEAFLREIGWREFASHLLYHFPHTAEAPLRADYARFPWADDPRGLRAWQRGRTGFPIVDAGMRQLWATGWMHNRVRMIVASFLVKDLRVSWLEGARWFWDTLVDADLAANTLGWQWAAGCGADAAPYFRIFNPASQEAKFDPDGAYVGRWVNVKAPDYPAPIVDHGERRARALAMYNAVRA